MAARKWMNNDKMRQQKMNHNQKMIMENQTKPKNKRVMKIYKVTGKNRPEAI